MQTFTHINSEFRNFSNDQVTTFLLITNKLRGHWSLVTFAFTLSSKVSDLIPNGLNFMTQAYFPKGENLRPQYTT